MTLSDGWEKAELTRRYRQLRARAGRLVGSNYDIANLCNLRCEGCLFFEGEDSTRYQDSASPAEWERFFATEAKRGVNWGYFAGAEPALVPERLRAAHRHISRGVIFTNGTIFIPHDITYRIHVSVWGDGALSERLRGADVLEKAIRHYRGDDRVAFVYTISAHNIDRIKPVTALLARNGLKITFSYFSPTTVYMDKLRTAVTNDDAYFRFSSREENLVLTPEDFQRSHAAIAEAQNAFPETVKYSLSYDSWATQSGGLYRIDPLTDIASDCGNRLTPHFRHHNVDLSLNEGKCCSPNIECRECRAYAQSYASFLTRHKEFSRGTESFKMWLDVWEIWIDLFLGPPARRLPVVTREADYALVG